MRGDGEVLALKHESKIFRQSSIPVCGSRKSQTAQSLPCSIMEKPHTKLDDCLKILLLCFGARTSGEEEKWKSGGRFATLRPLCPHRGFRVATALLLSLGDGWMGGRIREGGGDGRKGIRVEGVVGQTGYKARK